MILINRISDISKLSTISPLLVEYLNKYLSYLLELYDSNSLEEYGSLYLIEKASDWRLKGDLPFSRPFHRMMIESAEKVQIRSSQGHIFLWHICFVISNSYAISVFAEPELLTEEIKLKIADDYTERTVTLDVPKS